MSESFDIQRIIDAQNSVYPQVIAELRAGRKQTHWMWFICPQVAGLGRSAMARQFAISSQAEAQAYIIHPLLGARLQECAALVNAVENRSIEQILGIPDNMKFRSSMTLFAGISKLPEFSQALAKLYPEGPDPATLAVLAEWDCSIS